MKHRPAAWRIAGPAAVTAALAATGGPAHGQPVSGTAAARDVSAAPRPAPSVANAQVESVRGRVLVGQQAAPGGASPVSTGSEVPLTTAVRLYEGAQLKVPDNGEVRLRLADGSIVRVLAGSDVALRRLRLQDRDAPPETVIDLRRGRVDAKVTKDAEGRIFEIRAPGAVASVRGTHFRVSVHGDGRVTTAVTEGEVLVRPASDAQGQRSAAPVRAGQRLVVRNGRAGAVEPWPAPDGGL